MKIKGKNSVVGRTILIEPVRQLFGKTGALLCKVVAIPTGGFGPVRIMSPRDESISIFKKTTLGTLRDVDQTRAWREPSAEDVAQVKTDSSTNDLNNYGES